MELKRVLDWLILNALATPPRAGHPGGFTDLGDKPVVTDCAAVAETRSRCNARGAAPPASPRNFSISTTRAALERQIVGALRCCIDAHGPITKERLGSASKRVASAVLPSPEHVQEQADLEAWLAQYGIDVSDRRSR